MIRITPLTNVTRRQRYPKALRSQTPRTTPTRRHYDVEPEGTNASLHLRFLPLLRCSALAFVPATNAENTFSIATEAASGDGAHEGGNGFGF